MGQLVAALDVGGTNVTAGAVVAGEVVGDIGRFPIDNDGPADALLEAFADAVAHAVGRGGGGEVASRRAAVAFPSPFDYDRGVPLLDHKFGAIKGIDLRAELTRRSPTIERVDFLNDAEAAAIGEAAVGAGAGVSRVLVVTLGTGLGAALVVDGEAVPTAGGVVVPDLYRRETDAGPADDVFSARGLADLLDTSPDQLPAVVESADQAHFDRFGAALGRFLSPVVSAVQAEVVVVGGGAAGAFHRFGPALDVPVRCVRAGLGDAAALIGAAFGTAEGPLR